MYKVHKLFRLREVQNGESAADYQPLKYMYIARNLNLEVILYRGLGQLWVQIFWQLSIAGTHLISDVKFHWKIICLDFEWTAQSLVHNVHIKMCNRNFSPLCRYF